MSQHHPIDVVDAALMDIGRPDLANIVTWFDEDDGLSGYVEVNDDILNEADWAIVDRAEALACQAFGLPVPSRYGVDDWRPTT